MVEKILNGLRSYADAIGFIFKHRLWTYFLVPTAICLLFLVVFGAGAFNWYDDLGAWLVGFYPESWPLYSWIDNIVSVLSGVAFFFIGLLLLKNIVLVLAGPFMSMLSSKVESIVLGKRPPAPFTLSKFFTDIMRALRVSVRLLVKELFWTLVILGFGLLFAPIVPFALFFVQSYYGGSGNLDFALERRYNYRGSVAYIKANKGLALGNGMPYILLLMTVFGFLVALPIATVAGTLSIVKREKHLYAHDSEPYI